MLNPRAVDPLYRLEHKQTDERRAASKNTALTRLTELSDAHSRDDYSANARLREGMRKRKKSDRQRDEEAKVRIDWLVYVNNGVRYLSVERCSFVRLHPMLSSQLLANIGGRNMTTTVIEEF